MFYDFFRISRQTPEKSEVCRFSINFAKTISKITEISENYFENYSSLFNRVLDLDEQGATGGRPLLPPSLDIPPPPDP